MSSSQRPLPDNTQHSQHANVHSPCGMYTHNLSRRGAADLRLRRRGHWDRRFVLLTKYNSGVQSKKSGLDRSCDTYEGEERCIQVLARETEGNESFGRPRHRREYNNNVDIKEVGWGRDWIDLAQNMDSVSFL